MSINMNLFITSGRSVVALELVRLLGKNNNIVIGDSKKHSISFSSKYINKKVVYSSPNKNINQFKKHLLKIILDNNIDFLIPTCEEIFYISHIKGFIEGNSKCLVFCDNFKTLEGLHSKYNYIKYIKGLNNIKTPKTFLFNNEKSVKDFIIDNPTFDYVIKPEFSRFSGDIASNSIKGKSIKKFNFKEKSKYVIQEFIEGEAICVFAVFSQGILNIRSLYKNLLTYSSGTGIYFENYKNNTLKEFLINFGKQTSFHGQVSFDIIANKHGYYVIECNPRATSGVHLFFNNFLFETYFINSMKNEKINSILTPKHKSKSFKLALFLLSFSFIFKKQGISLLYAGLFKSKDIIYSNEDIKPIFYQFYDYLCYIYESLKNNESVVKSMTNDIEYNGIIK